MIGILFCYFFSYLSKYNVFLDVFLWSFFSSYFLSILPTPPCSFSINLPFMTIFRLQTPKVGEKETSSLLTIVYCHESLRH